MDQTGVRTETVDGVTLVHNPPVPLHPEKTVRFDEEIAFGGEETGSGAVLKPGNFAVDGRNRVFIYESSDGVIKMFDEDGRFIRNIGGKGQGPGEFVQAFFLGFCPDGRLLVTDFQTQRTSFFSPDGDFLASNQWADNISIPHLVLDGAFVAQAFSTGPGFASKLFLKTYDFEGRELKSWGEFVLPESKRITRSTTGGGSVTMGGRVPYSPGSVFAGDDRLRRIYHCLNSAYLIEVYDAEGRIFRKIDRPYERVPVTAADKREYLAARSGNKNALELYESMPWPDVKTVTERMLCDDRGSLWVTTNEVKDESGKKLTAYDIFDADGNYDARVWLDAAPMKFADGKMYRFKEDSDTGIRVLTRYRVVWDQARR
ncbi:MAG TPA: 6-bladed beta-propeller [Acidobacteriota bacterium]|nr:6-bladed beta-propeller [Acidobacteriota bacterium]